MVKILLTNTDGSEKTVEANTGISLMEALRNDGVEGIVAECGGSLSCATCHVIVDDNWLDKTGEVTEMEDDMLDCTMAERTSGSRLSCQIQLTDALDGLKVAVPDEQI